MPVNIPTSITLTVGLNESQLQFTRRILMMAAQRIGMPMLDQVRFADFFFPLCGEASAQYRIKWGDAKSDPSPLDGDLTMHDAEWKTLRNRDVNLNITQAQHDELKRRYDYFLA